MSKIKTLFTANQPSSFAVDALPEYLDQLNQDQLLLLQTFVLPSIYNAWDLDLQLSQDPFSQPNERIIERHLETIEPYLNMAAICLYGVSISPEDKQTVTLLFSAWGMFDWLEDLQEDLEQNRIHISPNILKAHNIHTIDDMWDITPDTFFSLKEYVLSEFRNHISDILKVKSWPLSFRIFLYGFFLSRMKSCAQLPFPNLQKPY